MRDFPGLSAQLHRLSPAGLPGNRRPPHLRAHGPGAARLRAGLRSKLQAAGGPLPPLRPQRLREALDRGPLQGLRRGLLAGGGDLGDTFPPCLFTASPSLFSSSDSRIHEAARAFCSGSLNSEVTPSCADPPGPRVCCSMQEKKMRNGHFLFYAPAYTLTGSD